MTALVELDRVSVHFDQRRGLLGRRSVLHAVEQVSLTIAEGETVGLVGESGSGKSTLGHVIAGLRKPTQGEMRFRGHSLDRATRRVAQHAIQIVFQDPFGALDPRMPVSAIIAEPLTINRIGSQAERRERAASLVHDVGLPQDALVLVTDGITDRLATAADQLGQRALLERLARARHGSESICSAPQISSARITPQR